MNDTDIVLSVTNADAASLAALEGRTFQLHVLPGSRLRLVSVTIAPPPMTTAPVCPVILKGERCGRSAGHTGKHMWANGD